MSWLHNAGMTRAHQLLHLQRDPVPPRPAATVLLLRDGSDGIEVLMTRRSASASFAPGAYVFPGGAIDPDDAAAHGIARRRPGQSDLHLTQAVAAIRESFEELGVLLAQRADGSMPGAREIEAMSRKASLVAQCSARGLLLAADAVFTLAHWITDRDLPKRFDVPFLVARMPPDQVAVADGNEQFEPVWVRPRDALARNAQGGFFIIFPTVRTLERLQTFDSVEMLLRACAASEQPLWTSCPRAGWLGGREVRYMEHEHPYGELELVSPDGQIVHRLDWQSERPVALLRNVMRLTAPNPGAMTGPGTNSYLVGEAATGFIVIDPGPADLEHVQRLWQAAGGDIRMIVCTHSHPDHSPGARPLQALCAQRPPILGLASAATANAASQFTPDQELADGQLLQLGVAGDPAPLHTLQVIHTPGHAANHLCLVLLQDGLLFSGDHVLNGSTTIVNPPDGEMGAYLRSLDRLAAACGQHGIGFILPAHGYVLAQAAQAIAALKEHRLRREAKVLRVLQDDPQGTLEDWVKRAYDDVPPRLWPMAMRSLLAHVQHLEAQGLSTGRSRSPAR